MDFSEAAAEIKATHYPHDEGITEDKIAKAIQNHVESLMEDINTDPNGYFNNKYQFWRNVEKE